MDRVCAQNTGRGELKDVRRKPHGGLGKPPQESALFLPKAVPERVPWRGHLIR